MVEQVTVNHQVVGSTPTSRATKGVDMEKNVERRKLPALVVILLFNCFLLNAFFAIYNMMTGYLAFWNGLGVWMVGGMVIFVTSHTLKKYIGK